MKKLLSVLFIVALLSACGLKDSLKEKQVHNETQEEIAIEKIKLEKAVAYANCIQNGLELGYKINNEKMGALAVSVCEYVDTKSHADFMKSFEFIAKTK